MVLPLFQFNPYKCLLMQFAGVEANRFASKFFCPREILPGGSCQGKIMKSCDLRGMLLIDLIPQILCFTPTSLAGSQIALPDGIASGQQIRRLQYDIKSVNRWSDQPQCFPCHRGAQHIVCI